MSDVLLSYRGRQIRQADLGLLRELIAQNPGLSRRRLSFKVCEAWHWVQPNGQPRDMVCRSLLLLLHRAGHLILPAKRQSPPNNALAHRRVKPVEPCDTTPIEGTWRLSVFWTSSWSGVPKGKRSSTICSVSIITSGSAGRWAHTLNIWCAATIVRWPA